MRAGNKTFRSEQPTPQRSRSIIRSEAVTCHGNTLRVLLFLTNTTLLCRVVGPKVNADDWSMAIGPKMAATSRATGPLAKLSTQDTEYLIELIRSNEAVWDYRHPNYRDPQIKKTQWTSIHVCFTAKTGIECTVEHMAKKFKALRSTFTRELRLVRDSKMSGSGTADDVRKPTWQFFPALQFLRDVTTIGLPRTQNFDGLYQITTNDSQPVSPDGLYQIKTNDSQPLSPNHQEDEDHEHSEEQEEELSDSSESSSGREETPPPTPSLSTAYVRERKLPCLDRAGNGRCETPPSTQSIPTAGARKRKLSCLDMVEVAFQNYIQRKEKEREQRKKEPHPLDNWLNNVRDNMSIIKKRRQILLKIEIDGLINNAIREQLESDSE